MVCTEACLCQGRHLVVWRHSLLRFLKRNRLWLMHVGAIRAIEVSKFTSSCYICNNIRYCSRSYGIGQLVIWFGVKYIYILISRENWQLKVNIDDWGCGCTCRSIFNYLKRVDKLLLIIKLVSSNSGSSFKTYLGRWWDSRSLPDPLTGADVYLFLKTIIYM